LTEGRGLQMEKKIGGNRSIVRLIMARKCLGKRGPTEEKRNSEQEKTSGKGQCERAD